MLPQTHVKIASKQIRPSLSCDVSTGADFAKSLQTHCISFISLHDHFYLALVQIQIVQCEMPKDLGDLWDLILNILMRAL